jgi:hypothetical protein
MKLRTKLYAVECRRGCVWQEYIHATRGPARFDAAVLRRMSCGPWKGHQARVVTFVREDSVPRQVKRGQWLAKALARVRPEVMRDVRASLDALPKDTAARLVARHLSGKTMLRGRQQIEGLLERRRRAGKLARCPKCKCVLGEHDQECPMRYRHEPEKRKER